MELKYLNKIIGIYGMMCSGKDTVSRIFEEQGYKKISISEEVLKPVLNSLKLKPDRLNYIKLGKSLKQFKPDALAFLAHGLMNKGTDMKYVIPNIMTFEEARYFKEQQDVKFILIKVSAEQRTRYERGIKRGDDKDVHELKQFINLDKSNLSQTGLKELMHARLEDEEIKNNNTINELRIKVIELMKRYDL